MELQHKMKTKSLPLMIVSFFALILLTSFGSAVVSYVDSEGSELTSLTATVDQGDQASLTFYLKEDGHDDITELVLASPMSLTSGSKSFDADITHNMPSTLDKSATSGLITATLDVPTTQSVGTYTGNLELTGKYASSVGPYTLPVSITVTQPPLPEGIIECRTTGDAENDLEIKISDIKVLTGFGDDNEWFPLDEVEIEIEVENKNDDEKIKNIVVEWGLYDLDTDEWYIDDEENDFDLKKKDDKVITITFKLDDNIDELEDGNFVFYAWATGEIDTETEDDVEICTSDSEEIEIVDESDFVVLDFRYTKSAQHDYRFPDTISCGANIQIDADVWNVGSDDQEEVYALIYNKELGILREKIIIGDVDAFEDEKMSFNLEIPEDVEEGKYYLDFTVLDDNDDIYENDYDDERSEFRVLIEVAGSCQVEPKATVSATLESGGKAGENLVVKTTITNTDSKEKTYTLKASGYEFWATLNNIEPATVTLGAGESKEVLYTLKADSSVSGSQTFNIEVMGDGTESLKQPVSVTIEKSGFSFTGGAIGGNSYLWGIGFLNVILIIIIIIVAIRIARK